MIENKKLEDFKIFLSDFKEDISRKGFKNTLQKDYILKVLYLTEKHLSAEEINELVKKDFNINIGIATIYRTMKFFEEMNIVETLDIGDSSKRYELNRKSHHDHLVCTNCGKIIEFTDDLIELKQIKVAEKNGFIMKDHAMTIYGECEDCQKH